MSEIEKFEGTAVSVETMEKHGYRITIGELPDQGCWEWAVMPHNFRSRPCSAAGRAPSKEDATALAMLVLQKAKSFGRLNVDTMEPSIEMTYAEADAIPVVEIVPSELPTQGVRVYRQEGNQTNCYLIRSTSDGGREMLRIRVRSDGSNEG